MRLRLLEEPMSKLLLLVRLELVEEPMSKLLLLVRAGLVEGLTSKLVLNAVKAVGGGTNKRTKLR